MKTTDVRCPVCGSMNKKLYLEETGGSMECDCCGSTVLLRKVQDIRKYEVVHHMKVLGLITMMDYSPSVDKKIN